MDTDRAHLERMIKILEESLYTYEEQAAAFGELYTPPFLKRQIEETRQELAKTRDRLLHTMPAIKSCLQEETQSLHNLPPAIELIDRDEELARLLAGIRSQAPIIIVEGMKGIGKQSLVCKVVHECWNQDLFDGIVWITGKEQGFQLDEVIDTLGRVLGHHYLLRLVGVEKQTAAHNLLRSSRVLVVVTSYEAMASDASLSGFLWEIPHPSKALLVRSESGDNPPNCRSYTMKGLEQADSLQLIRHECRRLGLIGVERVPEAELRELHELTSGNPHAIKLSIGQIKRFGLPLDTVLNQLRAAEGQLFEEIYSSSWRRLSPNAQLILMAIAVFDDALTVMALEAITGLPARDLTGSLSELLEMSLLETNSELQKDLVRYGVLALTKSYAIKQLRENPQMEEKIKTAAMQFFLHYCHMHRADFAALQLEYANIKVVLKWCEVAQPVLFIQLSDLLYPFYRDVGYWRDALVHIERAVALAESMPDAIPADHSARMLCQIASIYIRMGRPEHLDRAGEVLEKAKKVPEIENDLEALCAVLGRQARTLQKQKRLDRALRLGKQALGLARELNLQSRIADILHELGDTYFQMGDLESAEELYQESLELFDALSDDIRVAGRLNDLGKIAMASQRWTEARSLFARSITLCEALNKHDTLSRALNSLAAVEEASGLPFAAYQHAERAGRIAKRLGASAEAQQADATAERALESLSNSTVWILNFDNTLAESFMLHVEAWLLASHHFGHELPVQKLKPALETGLSSSDVADRMGIDVELAADIIELKRTLFRNNALLELNLFGDVPPVLEKLQARGDVLFVLSNAPEAIVEETIQRAGLSGCISRIVGQESLGGSQVTGFQAVVLGLEMLRECLPIQTEQWITVGDSFREYRAAREKGIRFAHCWRHAHPPPNIFSRPWKRISHFSELLEVA